MTSEYAHPAAHSELQLPQCNSSSTSGVKRTASSKGRMARYEADGLNPDMSMLEALDVLNED